MANGVYENGAMAQRRIVLRLGARVALDAIASLPARLRATPSLLRGKLGEALVAPATGDLWCRLNGAFASQIWPPEIKRVETRVFPLTDRQPPTPPPEVVSLFPGTYVACRDGFVGRLEGVVVESASGTASALVVRLRSRLEDVVSSPGDPLAPLVGVAGQAVLLAPAWAKSPETVAQLFGNAHQLTLDATAFQVAHSLMLRDDATLTQDIWAILGQNKAYAPYLGRFTVQVRDGTVTLAGPAISPRLAAAVEQDVWHVPGVLDVDVRLVG